MTRPVPDDCGHAEEGKGVCHVSALMPCPHHFTYYYADLMIGAPPQEEEQGLFHTTLAHLNNDGYALPAWFTLMGMFSRYAVPEGMDRLTACQLLPAPPVPPDAPEYFREAFPLVAYGARSAILRDADALDMTLESANTMLSDKGVLCFLRSCAGSTSVVVERNAACTPDHLTAWGLLGSQVTSGLGALVAPLLVDMVVHQQHARYQEVMPLLEDLVALPGGLDPLVTAVDIVARALAQTHRTGASVLVAEAPPGAADHQIQGVVDVGLASPEVESPGVMAGVWALRAAEQYAAAADEDDATNRIRELIREHGSFGKFGTDVVLAGTQILGYAQASDVAASEVFPGPEPE